MKRDHVKLICDIGELSGIFSDVATLGAFLQKIVEMTSSHMHSEVCSIYLFYENTQELVLRATKGLKLEAVGQVKLKLGEGLTGLALKARNPLCEKNASKNPDYRYFPEIGEEAYESFLAVPILRGQRRIGVMVVQNVEEDYFNEEDIKAFRAITSQLANTIETAKILMGLNDRNKNQRTLLGEEYIKRAKGKIGSRGLAYGEAMIIDDKGVGVFFEQLNNKHYTLDDFYTSLKVTEKQLEDMQTQIEEKLSDVASLIFMAQILMLKDKSFIADMVRLIKEEQINPPEAILRTVEHYTRIFEGMEDAHLQEKKQDVKDIGKRLLENMLGVCLVQENYSRKIIVAKELCPSDILKFSSQGIKGAILLTGGTSSHLSILARSLQIPLIISETPQLLNVPSGTNILLDAEQGDVHIAPHQELITSFKIRQKAQKDLRSLKASVKDRTQTKDGTRIKLLTNINLLCDLSLAREFKSEGVGLYRTEFPFLVRTNFPTEEEQFVIYKKLVDQMKDKEITFRTLDIGGDKVLSYYNYGKEENPFLGMRSIRFSLQHKDIFHQQLRAILRAGYGSELKILFPMISSVDEFLEAKMQVDKCILDLKEENVLCHHNPQIGIMIELPAVMEIIDELAELADFFSIGTNDFIQYMLAVDRTNEKVADLYLPHHPSVLRAFKKIVLAAEKKSKDVSICGDMAQNEQYISYFLGIGIRTLSVDAISIPKIQKTIEHIDLAEAQKVAQTLLGQNTIAHIKGITQWE
ncbi:Phosphoenolpyruvate-protein phosphotransferase of PTS system [hydrothermal vent metagenome]|uniref:phosphoenolpyruvate--protein phosphotransferase n=1 Tax=hydrothermal vent metagenome TaxID=652676 RepID=A0A3B1DGR6_9ZZZZ